jgi:catechol 2,3-dioxygenase-like lactoylglutathione lyase family enzyme
MTARGLDHIVHAVRDLDAAAAFYRRLGFTVGVRNRHSWGTHNYVVQLPGFFIELLTVAEPDRLGDDGISTLFGKYHQDFLAKGEGLSMLVLESKDAQGDVDAFSQAGIAASEKLDFEREAKRPDGTPIKVGFSLAFAHSTGSPSIQFMTCQQHHPENFWNPAFQRHSNGAQAIAGVVIVAGKPAEHRFFLSSYSGVSDVRAAATSLSIHTPRGEIAVMDPVGFRSRFGSAGPSTAGGARLAAIRFIVADLAATADFLMTDNVPFADNAGQIVIGGGTAMGATLVFEQAKTPSQAQR